MKPSLDGPKAKIERAKEHIDNLATEVSRFLQTKPYLIFQEDEPQTGDYLLRVRVQTQPPLRLAAIIGDTLHNLRSSLDLLIGQLVLANGKSLKAKRFSFPISNDANEFESGGLKQVQPAGSRVVAIVKKLKPYKGGNDGFWSLHELNRTDKHRLIMMVGAVYVAASIVPVLPGVPAAVLEKVRIGLRPANRLFPLEDGTILYRVPAPSRGKVDMNPQFTFEIAFGEGEVIKGEPILPTLQQFLGLAESTVNLFVGFFS